MHPPSINFPKTSFKPSAPAKHPRGTQRLPLTVAPFRAWRGSRISAARDPTLNASSLKLLLRKVTSWREFNPALADCGFRAPLPPHLARPRLFLNKYMAEREGFEPPGRDQPPTRSPGERLRPLSHLSARSTPTGGESEIRTREAALTPPTRFRIERLRPLGHLSAYFLFLAKKDRNNSRLSSAKTPPFTSTKWFKLSCCNTFITLPAAPARGSANP
ncbi:MAG: hypothetical protein PWQ16_1080 [bacterium]|nr:hypothetical protein [bacterium]